MSFAWLCRHKTRNGMIWLAFLIATMLLLFLAAIYVTEAVSRFGFIQKLSRNRNWLARVISFGFLAAAFTLTALALSLADAIAVFLHFAVFFLISDFLCLLLKKAAKREFRTDWRGYLALLAAAIYLSVGYGLCHSVWQTGYRLSTAKPVGRIRIAMFADSHLGTTFDGEGFTKHLEQIARQNPDLLAISGDFVDDKTTRKEMETACEALGKLNLKYGVWFCWGNHDEGYFNSRDFSAADLVHSFQKNGVHILEDETAVAGALCLAGRRDVSRGSRKALADILEGTDPEKYIIVLDHEPTNFDEESRTMADLVLLGHTHGGQFFPINRAGEWLGMNDRTYGCEERNGTAFIVTSGISDWAFRFKTGTKSEYVIIDVETKPSIQHHNTMTLSEHTEP